MPLHTPSFLNRPDSPNFALLILDLSLTRRRGHAGPCVLAQVERRDSHIYATFRTLAQAIDANDVAPFVRAPQCRRGPLGG